MTRDDIIKMAKEAGLDPDLWNYTDAFERFAALVAAAERKRIESRPWGAGKEWIARAIEAEREACADVCVKLAAGGGFAADCAAAIRARGEQWPKTSNLS